MSIVLNGEDREDIAAGTTIAQLLELLDVPERGIAVAVDAAVVPRGEWDSFALRDWASVEVLTAVQGG